MKKKLSMLFSIMILYLLFSCSASTEEPSVSPTPTLSINPAPTETVSAGPDVESAIKEYLSELGYEVAETKKTSTMLEIMLTLPGFSDQDLSEAPENWDDIVANFLEAETGARELSSTIPVVLYLQDYDGNNYLTILNGKEKYSAFKTYSVGGYNPPTITMEEYNAISTGMTYQEVYDIVGGPGEVSSELELESGYHTVTREWEGTGEYLSYAIVTFENGKVRSKHQSGLE